MFNQITYNVIIERFKVFAAGHYLIKRFSHGQIDNTDIDKDQQFPWLHVVPIEVRANVGERVYTFDVVIADLPRDKETATDYQKEIISDTIRIAEDVLAEIRNGRTIFGPDAELVDGSIITPFIAEYTHTLCGCTLALSISVPANYDACDLPATWSGGGSGSATPPYVPSSLVLKVNGVDNVVQSMLNLVQGTGITVADMGDGSVSITNTGGSSTGALLATEYNTDHNSAIGNQYIVGDTVYYNGNVYRCIASNDALIPTNTTYWSLVGAGYRLRLTPVDWLATSGDGQILNKPTIPTATSDLTNDSGYITIGDVPALGLQDVLTNNSTLDVDNTIDANDTRLEISNANTLKLGAINSIEAEVTDGTSSGLVSVALGNAALLGTADAGAGIHAEVETDGVTASISATDGTKNTQIAVDGNHAYIRTQYLNAGGGVIGDVLTLVDDATGECEWQTAGSGSGYVPYTGATSDVDLGNHGITADDGTNNIEVYPNYIKVNNAASTKYSQLDTYGLTAVDSATGDVMLVNAGGLTFPDTTSQYTAAVNADWAATSGLAEILNKPTLPTTIGDMLKSTYDTDNDGIVDAAEREQIVVINNTGATVTKGTIVYLKSSSSSGTYPEIVLATAATEVGSSKTIGAVYVDIANNATGYIITSGQVHNLNTSAYNIGDRLWLSNTAGQVTTTPPAEPSHTVFIGIVTRSQTVNGRVLYAIQNGYELDELHGVDVPAPAGNDYLYYDSGTALWKSRQLALGSITDVTTVGYNIGTQSNPSAIRYMRINADNSISQLSAAQLKSDLGFISKIQSTQLTNSSTTVGVDISGCSVDLEANSIYIGRMSIASGSAPVLGFTLTYTFPVATTVLAGRINSATATSAQVMSWQQLTSGAAFSVSFGNAQNQSGYAEIELYISVGATAGAIVPSFRSNSTGSAITIYAGLTHIKLEKL